MPYQVALYQVHCCLTFKCSRKLTYCMYLINVLSEIGNDRASQTNMNEKGTICHRDAKNNFVYESAHNRKSCQSVSSVEMFTTQAHPQMLKADSVK